MGTGSGADHPNCDRMVCAQQCVVKPTRPAEVHILLHAAASHTCNVLGSGPKCIAFGVTRAGDIAPGGMPLGNIINAGWAHGGIPGGDMPGGRNMPGGSIPGCIIPGGGRPRPPGPMGTNPGGGMERAMCGGAVWPRLVSARGP